MSTAPVPPYKSLQPSTAGESMGRRGQAATTVSPGILMRQHTDLRVRSLGLLLLGITIAPGVARQRRDPAPRHGRITPPTVHAPNQVLSAAS